MELWRQKKTDFGKALSSLEDILREEFSVIVRDASIQRFEYTVEVFWKCLKEYLASYEGIACYSPKSCIREYHATGKLSDSQTELLLKMIDDRNLTAHTYHESVSEEIYKNIPKYYDLMKFMFEELPE